ncbi:hypothetical protein TBLA_0C02800 [Henningerozyma blattae CBS 6284]|uniref:MICOS complex subunit MIC60 n=1 Tax=Henningerozyma blattae (strain ATCC 34711 / CBS 6284 / DSM 70876 / NBRC 10599 / NRRL Y-10934 / UCD 77-7) TaxID=1071380 RepID=I2H134_HENB6|nr:hypothetical protein TBLA_0C02800 [Tetrapisispora blattae CBS 6284]CCH60086.1 hypothetical protein TBLA_0C02800 [Tetrapisispora blattae CBS 6284]
MPIRSFLRPTFRRLASTNVNSAKTHTLRSILFKTTFGVSLFYTAGVIGSAYNEKIENLFIQNVPLGSELMDSYWFGTMGEYIEKSSDQLNSLYSTLLNKDIDKTTSKIGKFLPRKKEARKDEVKQALILKPVALNAFAISLNPSFEEVIDSINGFFEKINSNELLLTETQLEEVIKCHDTLDQCVHSFNSKANQLHKEIIEAKVGEAIKGFDEEYDNKLKKKSKKVLKKFQKEFDDMKANLTEKFEKDLKKNLEENAKLLKAQQDNEVTLVSITQLKEFTNIIKQTLDKERNGRLAYLEELDSTVGDLAKNVQDINNLLMKNEIIRQLSTTLAQFKLFLQHSESLDSNNEIQLEKVNSLIEKIIFLKRMLPKDSTVSCKCCVTKDKICRCKSMKDKSQYPLLDVTLSELMNLKSKNQPILSNEQLYNRWLLLESDFKTASLLPPNPGFLGHLTAKVFSTLLITKNGITPEGIDPDSIYSNVKENLKLSKIDKALETVVSLNGWPHILCDDWIKNARARLELETLIDILNCEVSLL